MEGTIESKKNTLETMRTLEGQRKAIATEAYNEVIANFSTIISDWLANNNFTGISVEHQSWHSGYCFTISRKDEYKNNVWDFTINYAEDVHYSAYKGFTERNVSYHLETNVASYGTISDIRNSEMMEYYVIIGQFFRNYSTLSSEFASVDISKRDETLRELREITKDVNVLSAEIANDEWHEKQRKAKESIRVGAIYTQYSPTGRKETRTIVKITPKTISFEEEYGRIRIVDFIDQIATGAWTIL